MSRRRARSRHFGPVVVSIDRDEAGDARGSVLELDGRRWIIDAFPSRVRAVEPLGGALVVRLDNGSTRLLDRWDAA